MSTEHNTPPVTETTATTTTSTPDASKHNRTSSKQAPQTTNTQAAAKDTTANETASAASTDAPVPASQASAEAPAFSVTGQMAMDQIKEYISMMAPNRPVSIEEGNRYQIQLYRAITSIINRLDVDFQPAFTSLLKSFDKHRDGVFHETYVFRFFDQMTLPENDRKAFQRLLNLLKVTASVKGRDLAMRQLDLESSLELGVTEPGRQRVLAYFRQ